MIREVIEGRMIGKRTRGRKRFGMLESLQENDTYERLKIRAQNREEWKQWMPRTCHVAEN